MASAADASNLGLARTKLQEEIEKSQEEKRRLLSETATLKDTLIHVERRTAELTSERSGMHTRIQGLEEQASRQREEVTGLRSKADGLQTDLNAEKERVKSVDQQNADLSSVLSKLVNELLRRGQQMDREREVARSDVQALKTIEAEQRSRVQDLEAEVKRQLKETTELKSEVGRLQTELGAEKEESGAASKRNDEFTSDIARRSEEVAGLTAAVRLQASYFDPPLQEMDDAAVAEVVDLARRSKDSTGTVNIQGPRQC